MAIELRAIGSDEVNQFRKVLIETFGDDLPSDEDRNERSNESLRQLVDPGRTYAAFDGDQMIATAAAFDLEVTIPGGTAPMAGLTMVAVRSSYRRRGILRRMIEAHFADVRDRGEALTGLWASEASIYGRFGYGPVGDADELKLDASGLCITASEDDDEIRQLDLGAAEERLPPIYDRARRLCPGMLARREQWWRERIFNPVRPAPSGCSKLRAVVCARGGEGVGYALYRQKPALESNRFAGTVSIAELIAVDATAEASLWRMLTNVDLFPRVSWWNAPTNSILPWIIDDPRRMVRKRVDHLWLRVDDVARALAARSYRADGRLRLGVADGGCFELEVAGGHARCTPTDAEPELVCDRSALGSIYLGGVKPSLLHRAGVIRGDARAAIAADQLFAWSPAPWCAEVF